MRPPRGTPRGRRRDRWRAAAAPLALAALALLLAAVAGLATLGATARVASADGNLGSTAGPSSGAATPQAIRVTAADARTDTVELSVIGAPATTPAADVKVSTEGTGLTVTGVTPASAAGRRLELVVVVDTDARGVANGVLESIKAQLATELAQLPATASVAVISAGDRALVEVPRTPDLATAAGAVTGLQATSGSALYQALERAGGQFTTDAGVIRSLLVISTGVDRGSKATADAAAVPLLSAGVQVVSLRYNGGDSAVAALAGRSNGLDREVSAPAGIGPAVTTAVQTAADRLLVSFTGKATSGTRSNVHVEVGGASTDLSYPAGTLADTAVQLRVQPSTAPSGFAFFRSSVGLYLSLVLAFVGIAAGVWALASIMAGGESSLEGVLSRYADNRGEVAEGDVEEMIVQSALLKRAINFGEAFAEKQGFLVRVEDMLERADLPVRAGEAMFFLAAAVAFGGVFGLLITRSFLAGLVLALLSAGICFFVVKFKGRRRFKQFESLLPDTLQLLAGTLRAGYSLPQGMEVVSREIADPMGQELRRAMTEARLGRELEECLSGVAERMDSADFAWAVLAIGIQREVGGNLNELLTSVADTMIARDRLRREVGALTAEGRMSAGILSFLPPGLGLIMWIMNPGYISLLFTSLIGNVFLGLGTVSALVGLAWMKKVITIDV